AMPQVGSAATPPPMFPRPTADPCTPPTDVSQPGRWWIGCWDTNAVGEWTPSPPVFYFDGAKHTFDEPEEYIAKLREFGARDELTERFKKVIRQRHPFSIQQVEQGKWTASIPKGRWYDTGIRITANMMFDVHANEGFQAKVGSQVFSADQIIL